MCFASAPSCARTRSHRSRAKASRERSVVARAMLEENLVAPGEAGPAEHVLAERVLNEVVARLGLPLFLRVDLVRDNTDAPILMEIEAIDAVLYLASSPGASERFAAAVRAS
jgi:hypothetical protein